MSVVEIALTAEQLAAAYTQLSNEERRSFLQTIFDHPAHQRAALDLLIEAQDVLRRKFTPSKQRLLDRLLERNGEGKLRPDERKRLQQLITEYGAGLVEKARARYVLELVRRAASVER